MYRVLEYAYFFVVLILLQVFLFSNVDLSVYIHPLVYVGFIILLPMELLPVAVLLLGFGMGVALDFMTASGGLHTIALLVVSFLRPYFLSFIIGRDEVKEGGLPIPSRLGLSKFFRYAGAVVFIHCLVFFTFESLTFRYYQLTLLRVLLSSALTLLMVYFSHMLLPESYGRKNRV